ncbi:lipid-A-disaccharide synthase [Nibricoccus sp. IMCC34717]|uniref:lipid-A-disaccharide synthase n=1 Tax=Nibricoccus sp. IMCC34717 TaxID=3034021 RepID=UPI00384E6629
MQLEGPLLPAPSRSRPDVLVIAGEHSGDQNAARMVAAFLERNPGAHVCALGGPALRSAGAELLRDLTATSVIGFVDTLRQLGYFKRLLRAIVDWIAEHKPRLVCFVDSSGLNLRIAAQLRERGLTRQAGAPTRAVYYISPQIWASRAKRRFAMARDLDALATIFPFESECYADTTLPVTCVGHPFVAPGFEPVLHYDPQGPALLLPGSRTSAVGRIFPPMLEAWRIAGRPAAAVITPSEAIEKQIRAQIGNEPVQILRSGRGVTAAAVLTTSGTMSMHCALAGIPGAVIYRANPIEYVLGRMLIRVPHLGIANLLLKREAYPEYIQGRATPAALANELQVCLSDRARRSVAETNARELRQLLSTSSGPGPGEWLDAQLKASPA